MNLNRLVWPDGTPRSQGNAFDWRRLDGSLLTKDPQLLATNRALRQKLDGKLVGPANFGRSIKQEIK